MRALALSTAAAALFALTVSSVPAASLKDHHCVVKVRFVQRVASIDKKGRFSVKLEPVPFAFWTIVGADTRLKRGTGLTDAGGRATIPVDTYEYVSGEPKSAGKGKDSEVYIWVTEWAKVKAHYYYYGELTLRGTGGSGHVGPVTCQPANDTPGENWGTVELNGDEAPPAPLDLPPPKANATPTRAASGTQFRVEGENFKPSDRILALERLPDGRARELKRQADTRGSVTLTIGGPQPPGAYAWCFLSRTNHSEACVQYVVN